LDGANLGIDGVGGAGPLLLVSFVFSLAVEVTGTLVAFGMSDGAIS
jgi:hypothetical protein